MLLPRAVRSSTLMTCCCSKQRTRLNQMRCIQHVCHWLFGAFYLFQKRLGRSPTGDCSGMRGSLGVRRGITNEIGTPDSN